MLGKTFLGPNVSDLDTGEKTLAISRVILTVDGETSYISGDDSGKTLEKNCPWGNQAMADRILASVSGVRYQPFTGTDGMLDLAAEVGDAITVGGIYSVLAQTDITFDRLCAADVSAPGANEATSEYAYKSRTQRQSERELARIRSSITKTAERITLLVENEVEGLEGKLELTASSLTTQITNTRDGLNSKIEQTAASLTTQINNTQIGLSSKIEQTAESIMLRVNGLNDAYSSISQTVDSISLGVFNGRESSTISLYKNGIAVQSQEISFSGMVTFNDLSGNRGTVINGGAIDTNTLRLNSLYGNYIYINDSYGQEAGLISATGSSSYAGQKLKISSGAIEITATPGDLYLSGGGAYYATLQLGSGHAAIGGDCIPNASGRYSCGSFGFKWSDVYADNDTIQTSDQTEKKEIDYDMERYSGLFDRLRPCSFLRTNGTSGRRHHGFIAQEVKEALEAEGLTGMDFAGYVEWENGKNRGCGLRYGEILAMLVYEVQQLKKGGGKK